MKYIIALMLLLIPVAAHAIDKKLGATNCFKIGIFSASQKSGGLAGLDVVTPFSDFAIKVQCGDPDTNPVTTVDESGDDVDSEGGGYYYICTNDTVTNNAEEECLAWVEGETNYVGLIAKVPVMFKATANIESDTYARVGTPAGASVSADTAAIKAETASIQVDTDDIQGRIPATLINGKIDTGLLHKQITVSAGTTASAIISTGSFTESSNKGYIGGIVNCPAATATENRPVFLKMISFDPATDKVILNGSFPTVLTTGDICNIYIDTIR